MTGNSQDTDRTCAGPDATTVARRLPPLALYVHLPWCITKCPYCDFNSHTSPAELPEQAYVQALLADLAQDRERAQGRAVESIFIGGGTPSLFAPQAIATLLAGIARQLTLAPDCEITLEANPGASDAARFRGYRDAGVNRLSIGVQSLDDEALERIGRRHGANEARRAVAAALAAGFDSVNVDLMFGLPRQSHAEALADLDAALALGTDHVSWYQLTLEPNTRFHAQPPPLPGEDATAMVHDDGLRLLSESGFERYEVSAFARGGKRCQHNLNYWTFGDYLGIGCGAHDKVTWDEPWRLERRVKQRQPRAYLASAATPEVVVQRREPSPDERAFELMLNGLRLTAGLEASLALARAGLGAAHIAEPLARARARGLMVDDNARLQATATGFDHLNTVLELFLGEEDNHAG